MLLATFDILEGQLEPFKESVRRSVEFADQNGPQLLVHISLDEPAMRAYSCQIHPNSEAILRHWHMAGPYIREVRRYMTPTRLDIHGDPSDEVRERLREIATTGLTVTITPYLCGFTRLAGW